MKNLGLIFFLIFTPLAFSQIKDLKVEESKYCEGLIQDFNNELKEALGDETGTFWIERKLLFFKNKHSEVFRFPIDRIHVNLKKESTYLEIQTNGNEKDVFWSSTKTTIPQFTSRATLYYKPKKPIDESRMQLHQQMLNDIINCLQSNFPEEDFQIGLHYIDSLKISKGMPVSKARKVKKVEKKEPRSRHTDVNLFSNSKNTKPLTAAEKAQMKRYKDSLQREVAKAWANSGKANGKTCPSCAGSGQVFIEMIQQNTTTTFSEDDANYYKKTTTSNDTYYNKVTCSKCNGSGKVSN